MDKVKIKTKIWIGPELEGYDKGTLTMFVKTKGIMPCSILSELERHPECKRLYLGAGRTDVIKFNEYLIMRCVTLGIEVLVETSVAGLKSIPEYVLEYANIILRMDIPIAEKLVRADCLKLDTGKNVYVVEIDEMKHTNLDELDGDTFSADTVIFDGHYNC